MTKITINKKVRCVLATIMFTCFMFLLYGPYTIQLPTPKFTLFYYNETSSLPRGIYLRVPLQNFQDGDYVVYDPTDNTKEVAIERKWMKEDELFLKKIGAMPNENYFIDSYTLQFFANGKYIGQVFLTDRNQLPMPEIRGEHIVPQEEFLPVSDNPHSFDGRYTGTVPIKNIKAKVVPLLTE